MTLKDTLVMDAIAEAAIDAISELNNEPEWIRQARRQAWETFEATPWPDYTEETWRRTRLTGFNLENFTLDIETSPRVSSRLELATDLRENLEKIDSAGALVFQNSSLIYAELDEELASKGIILTDLRTAIVEHEELVRAHLGGLVGTNENKFTALHYALWQNGTFLYVPRNIVLISESGINTREDIQILTKAGVHSFLIGEALMRAEDIGEKLRDLLNRDEYTSD